MMPSGPTVRAGERKLVKRVLGIGSGLILLMGLAWADSASELAAYLLVAVMSVLPAFLWMRQGRPGVPVLPAMAALCILYYAFPIVRGREDLAEYSPGEIFAAAATVALFLGLASGASYLMLRSIRANGQARVGLLSDPQMRTVVFLGLLAGTLFLAGARAGLLRGLGSFFGVARSVALTALVVACYLLGVARGRGLLRGKDWVLASGGLSLAILISWSSLFLVGGLTFLLASVVGYVTTRGRIPWLLAGAALVLVSILHAGKEEMRSRYWQVGSNTGEATSIVDLPRLAKEWFEVGLEVYSSPSKGRSALDRASLLQILLRVQRLTPEVIDYLRGESYLLLPQVLVPRFLDPTKPKSQIGMDLLNIRYGFLTAEGTEKTAVGWGLIAEAYANFGYLGVSGIALLVGFLSGAVTRWSAHGSTISLPTLVAVALMIGLVNLEQDLVSFVMALLQSLVAVLVFVLVLRFIPRRTAAGSIQGTATRAVFSQRVTPWSADGVRK